MIFSVATDIPLGKLLLSDNDVLSTDSTLVFLLDFDSPVAFL